MRGEEKVLHISIQNWVSSTILSSFFMFVYSSSSFLIMLETKVLSPLILFFLNKDLCTYLKNKKKKENNFDGLLNFCF